MHNSHTIFTFKEFHINYYISFDLQIKNMKLKMPQRHKVRILIIPPRLLADLKKEGEELEIGSTSEDLLGKIFENRGIS